MPPITLRITGMTSAEDERRVEQAARTIWRVASASADHQKGVVVVDYINGPPELPTLKHAIELTGVTMATPGAV